MPTKRKAVKRNDMEWNPYDREFSKVSKSIKPAKVQRKRKRRKAK